MWSTCHGQAPLLRCTLPAHGAVCALTPVATGARHRYALLRRRQCLLELAYGMQPETLHGNM